ncbi:methyl-accepting chemotaxis protein [Endozoicomonas gorgoniicola]|uniref:Methyl-accepting chemotaxis protein n=1 Tax=Endozoicomonas gorgoniicola TaxID=1234144 RepID=A0ABT3MXV3_9GAMM|nr:methyl-accepting chemotaxis protein [Endozoicomonas gorgoniicola]MCW7554208.1 methyl-accepting chemotaxis protein [Endozoicomonas gorgoniicola]
MDNAKKNTYKSNLSVLMVIAFLCPTVWGGLIAYQSITVGVVPDSREILVFGLSALGFFLVFFLSGEEKIAQKNRMNEIALEDQKNQNALIQLLNELQRVSEGDLTTRADVNAGFTTAIADSINYAIENLQRLVQSIDSSAQNVDLTAKTVKEGILQVASEAEAQQQDMSTIYTQAEDLENRSQKISKAAQSTGSLAVSSVESAHKGNKEAIASIAMMNEIRQQIQTTSKRVKRLGESGQQIADIGEIINDIAEQTNILSLNASVQASIAGDAGVGFSIVANEIQRLAERCTASTKKIDILVKTIQQDAHQAVTSMEQATDKVVTGAGQIDATARSLSDIQKNINAQESLTQTITDEVIEQETLTRSIKSLIEDANRATEANVEKSKDNAANVLGLNNMSRDMRTSIAGFKVRADDQVSNHLTPDSSEVAL